METHNYGLIGQHLSHSFSKTLFEEHFGREEYSYDLIELDSLDTLREEVERRGLDGFNVTIPYKTAILPLLDDLDDTACSIGAVNTVRVLRNGSPERRLPACKTKWKSGAQTSILQNRTETWSAGFQPAKPNAERPDASLFLKGFNTDAPAFEKTIQNLSGCRLEACTPALVLGTGGAAKAVAYSLEKLGIEYLLVSRTPHGTGQIDYATAYALAAERALIVNATPVGMFPNCSLSPWQRPELLTPRHLCYDLVYNPSPTRFLAEAAAHGATAVDGLQMLRLQAHKAWHLWGLE